MYRIVAKILFKSGAERTYHMTGLNEEDANELVKDVRFVVDQGIRQIGTDRVLNMGSILVDSWDISEFAIMVEPEDEAT